jgi:L-2-hydroxyglutarate oxidase
VRNSGGGILTTDIIVIGGGLVGLATAVALTRQPGGPAVVVLEGEDELASHQSGHNSGVLHSGLYYRPGSLKAVTCTTGRRQLEAFCLDRGLPYRRTGKLVVAVDTEELPRLAELERRGQANGLEGLRTLGPEEIREIEPAIRGVRGLWVPETGIVDFRAVAAAYAEEIRRGGGEVRTGARVRAIRREGGVLSLETGRETLRTRFLINCAGLWSDRVARLCGLDPGVRIVPFRGEYLTVVGASRDRLRGLVYPVPDPDLPFLGVHFTRTIDDQVEAGPNAVLAFKRAGYRWRDVSLRDSWETLSYGGFWRFAARFWRTGIDEVARSVGRRASWRALQRLMPELRQEDLRPGGAGVRAQALDPRGRPLDDFHIVAAPGMVHVLNAPSPAATASLAIGQQIARMVGSGSL